MSSRFNLTLVMVGFVGAISSCAMGQGRQPMPGGGGVMIAPGQGGPWGFGQTDTIRFEQFMGTLSQLNMTPDFTIEKEAKAKLQGVSEEWQKAQTKFMEDNKDELQQLRTEQMEAFRDQDKEKIKEVSKKLMDAARPGQRARSISPRRRRR